MAKVERSKIEKFLREKMNDILANDASYQDDYKKIQLLCTVYGYKDAKTQEEKKEFEEYVYGWGGAYLQPEYEHYFYSVFELNFVFNDYVNRTRFAMKNVETWDKQKAKLEQKLLKAQKKGNFKKAEKLEDLLKAGEDRVTEDRVIVDAKIKADKCIESDEHYFENAACAIKRAEKRTLRQIIAENTNSDEIEILVNNVLKNAREGSGSFRVYSIAKDVVKEENAIMEQKENADKLKENLAQSTTKEETSATQEKETTEDERESE